MLEERRRLNGIMIERIGVAVKVLGGCEGLCS